MTSSQSDADVQKLLEKYKAFQSKMEATRRDIQAIKEENLRRLGKLVAVEREVDESCCDPQVIDDLDAP